MKIVPLSQRSFHPFVEAWKWSLTSFTKLKVVGSISSVWFQGTRSIRSKGMKSNYTCYFSLFIYSFFFILLWRTLLKYMQIHVNTSLFSFLFINKKVFFPPRNIAFIFLSWPLSSSNYSRKKVENLFWVSLSSIEL